MDDHNGHSLGIESGSGYPRSEVWKELLGAAWTLSSEQMKSRLYLVGRVRQIFFAEDF